MKRFALTLFFLLCLALVSNAQYDKDVFNFRGRAALADGKYSEAISHFNILARLDTTDCWTFFYQASRNTTLVTFVARRLISTLQ